MSKNEEPPMKRAALSAAPALALALSLLTACGATPGETKAVADPAAAAAGAPGGSLYDRMGGKPAITVVVDDFVGNVVADDAIKTRFRDTDAVAFKAKLVDQICEATGGPCKYTGKSMKESHAGMKISDAEFTALVNDLKKALDKNKVGAREQTELLTALGSMHGDIVNQ
jgi:hemoglobin